MEDNNENAGLERWKIIPFSIPKVRRNCPKCKEKREFINSMKFRVNANGKNVDVWLIYRCEKCSTTWNLAVYERSALDTIPGKEYAGFLDNDRLLAERLGSRMDLFAKNKAAVVPGGDGYRVEKERVGVEFDEVQLAEVQFDEAPQADDMAGNPFCIIEIEMASPVSVRLDSLLAEQLGVSRSVVKKWCRDGEIFKIDRAGAASKQGDKLYRERMKKGMIIGIRNISL